jgi:glycosyltransferase involved in cell wall biosynthesis
MRIAIWSNAPWALTGYGGQVRGILPRLMEDGHEPCVIANYGLGGAMLNWNNVPVYPLRESRQNADVLADYVQHFNADVVISLYDVWALPADSKQRMAGRPWIAMTPVDGAPVSNAITARLRCADYVIAYSKFGKAELGKVGIEAHYVSHAIDIETFSPGDKVKARQALGVSSDVYLVTIVAANKGFPARKAWAEALRAFKVFHERYPNTLLYCHTTKRPFGSGGEGIDFDGLIDHLGLSGAVAFPDHGALAVGVSDESMAEIYRVSDVMLLPSMGEGFGLPVLEAQACGCPVITQDCSAMSELTENGISIAPGQPFWLPQLGYNWSMPYIDDIADGLEWVYMNESRSDLGVAFAQGYSWPNVWTRYWRPFLEHVEETLW